MSCSTTRQRSANSRQSSRVVSLRQTGYIWKEECTCDVCSFNKLKEMELNLQPGQLPPYLSPLASPTSDWTKLHCQTAPSLPRATGYDQAFWYHPMYYHWNQQIDGVTNQACYSSARLPASPHFWRPDPCAPYRNGESGGLAFDHRTFPRILAVHTLANKSRVSKDFRVDESSKARSPSEYPCARSFHFSTSKPAVAAESTDADNTATSEVVTADISAPVSDQTLARTTPDSNLLSEVLASTRRSENKDHSTSISAILKQAKSSPKEMDSVNPLKNASNINPETESSRTTKERPCATAEKDEIPTKDNDKNVPTECATQSSSDVRFSPHGEFRIKASLAKSISRTQVERNVFAVEESLSKHLPHSRCIVPSKEMHKPHCCLKQESSPRKRMNFIETIASVKEDIESGSSRYSKMANKALKFTAKFNKVETKTIIRDIAKETEKEKKRFCKTLAARKRRNQATNTPKGRNNGNMSDSSNGSKGNSERKQSSERMETLHPKGDASNEVSRLNLFEKLEILIGHNNKYESSENKGEKENLKNIETSTTTMDIEFNGKRQNSLKPTDSRQDFRGESEECLSTRTGKSVPECVNESILKAETSQKFPFHSCSVDLPPLGGCSEKQRETRHSTVNVQKRNHQETNESQRNKTCKRRCKRSPKKINRNNIDVGDKGKGDEPAKIRCKLPQEHHSENHEDIEELRPAKPGLSNQETSNSKPITATQKRVNVNDNCSQSTGRESDDDILMRQLEFRETKIHDLIHKRDALLQQIERMDANNDLRNL